MNAAPGIEDRLIAHRGWPARYPENSIAGVRAVLAAGARQVEIDVQLTAEAEAVVVHDDSLRRLTGRDRRVTGMRLEQLSNLGDRDGNPLRIPTLSRMVTEFDDYPDATVFIELKRHSIARFGRRAAVDAVIEGVSRVRCRWVFISFDWRAAALARRLGVGAIGWVFRFQSAITRMQAAWLKPDYLFIQSDRIGKRSRPFWPGPWQWVVYDVDSLEAVDHWYDRGADRLEVDDLPGLLSAARDTSK